MLCSCKTLLAYKLVGWLSREKDRNTPTHEERDTKSAYVEKKKKGIIFAFL